jgi:flagellar protein FliO/FliZ
MREQLLLAVTGAAAWVIRHLYENQNRSTDKRPRPTRLAIIETAAVIRARRVILVRRDNVEHLLMIGGPTDVVIEPNIVRADARPQRVHAAVLHTPRRRALWPFFQWRWPSFHWGHNR